MAEFTAGDRVVKMSGIAAGKYGTVNSVREDGTLNVTFDGERMARFCDPERCGKIAANAKYKTGDFVKELASGRTWRVGRMGNDTVELWQWPGSGMTVTTIREVEDGNRFIPAPQVAESWKKVHANSRAANAKFKVGDRAWYKEPSTGEKIEITITGVSGNDYEYVTVDGIKGRTVGYSGKGLYPLNARACNAEITPELRKAYDEWMKAKAKFDKWWNPNRRLSENPPKGADETRKRLDFAAVFKKVTGKLTPNGYGSMTLEQMVDAVSRNAVARNGLSPYGAVSGLLALKWYDKKDDKGGGVMIVRAPFEAVKRYLEQSARNYPYKIAPYGRGWAKVTAPFEW